MSHERQAFIKRCQRDANYYETCCIMWRNGWWLDDTTSLETDAWVNYLPSELWHHIFSHLTGPVDVRAVIPLSRTCKTLHEYFAQRVQALCDVIRVSFMYHHEYSNVFRYMYHEVMHHCQDVPCFTLRVDNMGIDRIRYEPFVSRMRPWYNAIYLYEIDLVHQNARYTTRSYFSYIPPGIAMEFEHGFGMDAYSHGLATAMNIATSYNTLRASVMETPSSKDYMVSSWYDIHWPPLCWWTYVNVPYVRPRETPLMTTGYTTIAYSPHTRQ